jgi:hypothetical protein
MKLPPSGKIAAVALVGWLGLAASAASAEPEAPDAAASALIASQNAGAAFRALPNPNAALVQHIQSGMPCLIAKGTKGVLTLYKPDGTDVGCEQDQPNGVSMTFFAVFAPSSTAEDAIQSLVRSALGWRWRTTPDAVTTPPSPAGDATLYRLPQVAMIGELDGVRTFVRLAAFKTSDGWLVMQRFIAPVAAGGPNEKASLARGLSGADYVMMETDRFMVRLKGPAPSTQK